MDSVFVYNNELLEKLVRPRQSELKIGQKVIVTQNNWQEELNASACRFVLLGIPEDIGVRANFGRGGAATAVRPTFDSFLNQQSNSFLSGEEIYLLGELNVQHLMLQAQDLSPRDEKDLLKLRKLTSEVDDLLIPVMETIIRLKKIPVVVGGGHNNAYGNLVGAARALGKGINTINCDPHLDFRALEGRHSGNGFSYAFAEKALAKYAVLGMHEQYNNQNAIELFRKNAEHLYFRSYESMFIATENDFSKGLADSISFVRNAPCGVELDLDAITNVPSSAKTSSGISPVQARQYIYQCGYELQTAWLHIAEGAPVLSHIKADNKTGKLIAYLMTDFMKAVLKREEEYPMNSSFAE